MPTNRRGAIHIVIDLKPYKRLAEAQAAEQAARNEWAQAHLTDAETEDARQRVLLCMEEVAAAVAALPTEEEIEDMWIEAQARARHGTWTGVE